MAVVVAATVAAYCTNNSPVCSRLRRLGKSADIKTTAQRTHTRTPAALTETPQHQHKYAATCSCTAQSRANTHTRARTHKHSQAARLLGLH